MHPSSLAKRGTVLLFLAVVAFYFYGLGHLPFVGPDEPRYAQVAREMFLRGDLITPTLGGRAWFEKPALLYWMMILSFKLFGVSEWAARLPAAVSGVLTVAAVFVVGHRIEAAKDLENKLRGYAVWSAVAAATMIGIIVFSQAASFDIVLTMTTTWALGFYLLYECSAVDEKPSRWLLAGCYCFIGLSLLAKGLVGIVIPVGVLGLFHLVQRRLPRQQILLSLFWGLPLALIVAGSWYVPVTWRHGWLFIDQFFIQHHFARYVSNKYHHAQPAYYYLLVVPLLSLPWTLFLFAGLIQFILRLWRGKTAVAVRGDLQVKLLMSLTLAWFFCPLVFFSFSGSKLPGYVLPLLPAGALIVGKQLCELRDGSGKWLLRATAFAYVMFALGVVGYSWRTGTLSLICAFLLAAPLLAAGCFPFLVNRKASASVALMAGMTVVELIAVMFCVAPRFAEFESSRRLLQLADARGYSQATVYGIQRSDRTPEFYAAGRVVYGSDGEPIMYEGPAQVIYECRKRNEVLLAFVPIEDVGSLTAAADVRAEVIGDNTRYAIVAVRSR